MRYKIRVKKTAETVLEIEARTKREATSRAITAAMHSSVLWEQHHFKPVILQTWKEGRNR